MKRYCGREFSDSELNAIDEMIHTHPEWNRATLSREVCRQLNWRKLDGGLKEMSCRVAMLRMQTDGRIQLPLPQKKNNNTKTGTSRYTVDIDPQPLLSCPAGQLGEITLERVQGRKMAAHWNAYIARYHYLGHKTLPGAQMRYFVRTPDQIIACLGFGAAAWATAPRDQFIGWTAQQREKNLYRVVNNARFLILPWVQSKNLASKILALAGRQLVMDWEKYYHYTPVLLETFVERPRFTGTCYKAANWLHVGTTTGRGRNDRFYQYRLCKKDIFLFPLNRKFRRLLCQ